MTGVVMVAVALLHSAWPSINKQNKKEPKQSNKVKKQDVGGRVGKPEVKSMLVSFHSNLLHQYWQLETLMLEQLPHLQSLHEVKYQQLLDQVQEMLVGVVLRRSQLLFSALMYK